MGVSEHWKSLSVLSLIALPVVLGGCGASPSAQEATIMRGVFTTATDCAAIGTLSLEACTRAIETAIRIHEANAPSYSSLKACEKAEGTEKCERTDTKLFRPRLMAFMVAMSDPPEAVPLYPTAKGETGFRTAGNSVLLTDDESLTFSRQALAAAELLAGEADSGGGFSF